MAIVRFALVCVCYISEEHVWSSSPQGHVGEGTIFSFLCMCALCQSCQNHLAGPVKKVACILLVSGFQRCFDDGGLFLVMDAG